MPSVIWQPSTFIFVSKCWSGFKKIHLHLFFLITRILSVISRVHVCLKIVMLF